MTTISAMFVVVMATLTSAQIRIRYETDEEVPVDFVVGDLKRDSGSLDRYSSDVLDTLRFGLLSLKYQTLFLVDEVTGIVYVKGRLDREELCSPGPELCVIPIEAAIVQPTEYFTVLHVDVTVRDINDNSPSFSQTDYTLFISENSALGSQYMLPMATDPDSGLYGIQSYYLKEANALFSLVEGAGPSGVSLLLDGVLDRESEDVYSLQVVAVDGGVPPKSGVLTVHVQVIDANDNSPVFDKDLYEVTIPEDYDLQTAIVRVSATDLDEGQNGQILYTLSPQSAGEYGHVFAINNETGVIFLTRELDYQMGTSHQLVVLAYDLGSNPLQAHTTVVVHVLDVNNHKPQITVYPMISGQRIGVRENAMPGEIVALVTVKDDDTGENGVCTCQSLDNSFRLEEMYKNGFKIVSSKTFDRELADSYELTIRCQDYGSPALSSLQQLTVNIFDENDNSPLFDRTRYRVSVREDAPVGSFLIRIHAKDPDTGKAGEITYSLNGEALNQLDVDSKSGLVTLREQLDHEKAAFYNYSVSARDNGTPPEITRAELLIDVVDVNDEAPVFIQHAYNFGTYENQASVVDIGTVTAVDRDSEPYNRFAYSLYGESRVFRVFSIDSQSGRISSRVSLDREDHDVYHLIAMATDIEPPYLSSSVSVTIYVADKNDNSPIITFPNQVNNSVQVSAYSPLDLIFSRVLAHDLDLGKNAKLEYSLVDDYGLFSVDPMQGYLYVKSNLHNIEKDIINLQITVTDEGSPPLSTNATLQVKINKTVIFAQENALFVGSEKNAANLELSEHEKILIALGVVTSLVVAILIAAIVFVKRRQMRSRSKEVLHCIERVNYTQKLASLTVCQLTAEETSTEQQKDRSQSTSTFQTNIVTNPSVNRDQLKQCSPLPVGKPEFDVETDSRYSAELSNTDSGHGPSEEGDITERVLPNDNTKHRQQLHGTETGPTSKLCNRTWNTRNLPPLYRNSAARNKAWHRSATSGRTATVPSKPTNANLLQDNTAPCNTSKRDKSPYYKGDRWHTNHNECSAPAPHDIWPSTDGDESNDDNCSASSGSFIIEPLHHLKSIDV